MFIEEEGVYGCQGWLDEGPHISRCEVVRRGIGIPSSKSALGPLGQVLLAKLTVRPQFSPISKSTRGLLVGTVDHAAIDESCDPVDLFAGLLSLPDGTKDVRPK